MSRFDFIVRFFGFWLLLLGFVQVVGFFSPNPEIADVRSYQAGLVFGSVGIIYFQWIGWRRFEDAGKNPWWCITFLIPYFGHIAVIVAMLLPSKREVRIEPTLSYL